MMWAKWEKLLRKNNFSFLKSCLKGSPHNILSTCICVFAEAYSEAKLARKLHKKGAVGDRPSNFRDKTNVRLKRVLGASLAFRDKRIYVVYNYISFNTNNLLFSEFYPNTFKVIINIII